MRRLSILLALATILAVTLPANPAHAVLSKYACNPGPSEWALQGAWPSGTILESRVCLRYDTTTNLVQAFSEWRTRRGGTAIQSDWDLNGTHGDNTQAWYSITGKIDQYGFRQSFGDAFNTSYVVIQSFWECDGEVGTVEHRGHVHNVSADPNDSDGPSGYKDAASRYAINANPSCN
jgi:hypothetical protein